MQRNVLKNLHYAGVAVAREKLEFLNLQHLKEEQKKLDDDIAFLRSIELFDPISLKDLEILNKKIVKRLCIANEPVVIQGDKTNTSLFLVQEGFLNVLIKDDQNQDLIVGWLAAGMFFGEMSLLTGARRSASIVPTVDAILLEIRKEDFAPLLEKSEDLVHKMGLVLATRQAKNNEKLALASEGYFRKQEQQLSIVIIKKITKFFGLNKQ